MLKYLHLFLCFLSLLCLEAKGSMLSFENGSKSGWSTSKGVIEVVSSQAKIGSKALQWDWTAHGVLTYNNSSVLGDISYAKSGGLMMWIYNETPSKEVIQITFKDRLGTARCKKDFSLDFTGWRCFLARLSDDMALASSYRGQIQSMSILAPRTGSGTLLFDHIDFQESVTWERMSDFHYTVKESPGIDSYLESYEHISHKPVVVPEGAALSIEEIENRIDSWLVGTNDFTSNHLYQLRLRNMQSYISKAVNSFPTIAANGTINNSGLYPQYLLSKSFEGTRVLTFREVNEGYLFQLALDYRINGNRSSLEKIEQLYRLYARQGWAKGSALGSLRFEMLRSAGLYHSLQALKGKLSTDIQDHFDEATGWYNRLGDVYKQPEHPGELADFLRSLAVPKLYTILSLENEQEKVNALKHYQRYMDNALKEAPGFLGSIKPDGSGYHHLAPYYSAYYPDVLYAASLVYYLLSDTSFALSEESFENLKKSLLAFQFFCAGNHVPGSTTGRFPTQTEILPQILPAFAYMIEGSDDQQLKEAFNKSWNINDKGITDYIARVRTDICLSSTLGEVDILLKAAQRSAPEAKRDLTGASFLPFSGMMTYRQDEWMINIKGYSKYIWDYEATASENPYGRYISYAHAEYSDLKNGYRSYNVAKQDAQGTTAWDWQHLTGITARHVSLAEFHYNSKKKDRNYSPSPYLGGVVLDNSTAIFSNRLVDNRMTDYFTADKTTFFIDNHIYALGSNISCEEGAVYYSTTLFQHKENGQEVVQNGDQIVDNFGNLFLVENGEVVVEKEDNVVRAYIDHGKGHVNHDQYAYHWIIQPTEAQKDQVVNNNPIQVLAHNQVAHAIAHQKKGLVLAAIFDHSQEIQLGKIIRVNKPMIAAYKDLGNGTLDVVISNPDMDRPSGAGLGDISAEEQATPGRKSVLGIVLHGRYELTSDNPNITIQKGANTTTIEINNSCDSQSYCFRLTSLDTNIEQEEDANQFELIKMGDSYQIRCNTMGRNEWQLINMQGGTIRTGAFEKEQEISLQMLNRGIYVLRVQNKNITKTFYLNR